jgi:hypothetical protein
MIDTAGLLRDRLPNIAFRQHAVSFNTFLRIAAQAGKGVNEYRDEFWHYVRDECGLAGDLSPDTWWDLWEGFTRRQDARDERETQADAVGACVQ